MRYRSSLLALVLVFSATANAVEPSDLKPGLIATYSEPQGQTARQVTRLEPTVAITLGKGETPHPALQSSATMKWKGYLNLARAGKYRFDVKVQGGKITVNLDGKDMLTGSSDSSEVLEFRSVEIQSEGGVIPLEVTFKRDASGPARVELFWQGPGFIKEPLPNQFLGHLPADRPAAFTNDLALEHGRFKFEELACAKCHRPAANDRMAKTLTDREGPNLTDISKRAYAGWIYSWLADPAKLRPHTTMPKTFSDDAMGAAERFAVTQYLISLSGTTLTPYKLPTVPPGDFKQSLARGRVLYNVAGCAACHSDPLPKKKKDEDDEKDPLAPVDYFFGLGTLNGPTPKYNLGALGSKTRPEILAAYLRDPHKTNPTSRMPNMKLNQQESTDIARYLCRIQDESVAPEKPPMPKLTALEVGTKVFEEHFPLKARDEIAALKELPVEKQWLELGRVLTDVKGCINCHTIEVKGKKRVPLDAFPKLDDIKTAGDKGCLSEKPDAGQVAVYKLDPKERDAIAAFVKEGFGGAGSPAPAYKARVALRRFNCLNCHTRDGEGGIPLELADQMRLLEKAENADDVRPPVLTGVGHKARTSWLKSVLTQSGRARPWMQLRMPQYGEANVGFLPEAIASLEGTLPDDKILEVQPTAAKLAAGKNIVGKGGLGCISCHDIGGIPNTGTRGPDLATINQRVRYEWYERWLSQPLRMAPGTRMPQAFVDGKSTLTTVFDGNPHLQAEAMWSYLSLGPGLPLPDGLEPPKGLIIAVKERPEVLRTFMPDAGNKAIAVGYPGYVSVAFSADQCRLTYAWSGNFLDVSPVWNGRGGNPAKILGQRFWSAPLGHPWGLTANPRIPPDFLGRANNPAFGLTLPLEPARIFNGPLAVKFDGYGLDKDGQPTFRYQLDEGGKDAVLRVAETPFPLKNALASGFGRKFGATIPGGYQGWLHVGITTKQPRLRDKKGREVPLDLKAAEVTSLATGVLVVLPGEGDRATVIEPALLPLGITWRFVQAKDGSWHAILRMPESKSDQKLVFSLNLWALPKDDDKLLKELLAQ
ncbi:MAG: c-type cytochrome [Planctomycetia bacterium]|nr:c-type cytochrome [Planctomycetia bacterium]